MRFFFNFFKDIFDWLKRVFNWLAGKEEEDDGMFDDDYYMYFPEHLEEDEGGDVDIPSQIFVDQIPKPRNRKVGLKRCTHAGEFRACLNCVHSVAHERVSLEGFWCTEWHKCQGEKVRCQVLS